MAEFSRIQVTPAEEEDTVIIAGVVEESAIVDPPDAPCVAGAPVDEVHGAEEMCTVEEQPASSRKRDAYRETVIEDLERTHMSGMQKAIIALAIAAVAAFMIWYVLLR